MSYFVKVDNRFFTRPRRLLRPVTPDKPFPVVSSTPPSSPPPLCRFLRLQSRANSVLHQSSSSVPSSLPLSLSPQWHPTVSFPMDKTCSRISKINNSWKNTSLSADSCHSPLPLSFPTSMCKTTANSTSRSNQMCPTSLSEYCAHAHTLSQLSYMSMHADPS